MLSRSDNSVAVLQGREAVIAAAAALLAFSLGQNLPTFVFKDDGSQTNSTTNYANVADLTVDVLANSTYRMQWIIVASAAATTTGIQLAVNGPANTALFVATITCFSAVGTPASLNVNAYDTGLDLTDSAGTTVVQCTILVTITTGANDGGTVAARVRSEVGGSAITIYNGSSVIYYSPG